jgi:hypothetical protein
MGKAGIRTPNRGTLRETDFNAHESCGRKPSLFLKINGKVGARIVVRRAMNIKRKNEEVKNDSSRPHGLREHRVPLLPASRPMP